MTRHPSCFVLAENEQHTTITEEMAAGGWLVQEEFSSWEEDAKAGLSLVSGELKEEMNLLKIVSLRTKVVQGAMLEFEVETKEGKKVSMEVWKDFNAQYKLMKHNVN